MPVTIAAARIPEDLSQVRSLFCAYADALGFDLGFQNFEDEVRNLPGEYSPPTGKLLLAWHDGTAVGCVALRKLEEGICEMKRMYVQTDSRGEGIGRRLAERLIAEALQLGYRAIRLDTVPSMTAAIAMYRDLGFVPISPYRHNPIQGALFMELSLALFG